MKSKTTDQFWKCHEELPANIKEQAKDAFQTFLEDPHHPSLNFKRIHSTRRIFSVRISLAYRAIGLVKGDEIIWFWIGAHSEYEKIIKTLRRA